MSKEEEVWDAVQVLEKEVAELKEGVNYCLQLIFALSNVLNCKYKTKEIVMKDGRRGIEGKFEKQEEKKSHLILP